MKVSVIIPAYNSAPLLPRAVKSVLAQTFQDFEVIVVDDASTDETERVVRAFMDFDPRIHYFRLETNSGGAARPKNVGLERSSGEFVAVLDADDEWLPKKLERQLALFAQDPDLGFVGGNALIVEADGRASGHRLAVSGLLLDRILETDFLGSGSSLMYRKKVFAEVGGFDENLKTGQDWEMRIRLVQRYKFALVDGAPLIKYHQHAGNISNLAIERKQADLDYIENKYSDLYRTRPKVYSNKLRYDGTRYMIAGRRLSAWRSFLRSLRFNPLNFRTYLYLFLSLFGSRAYLALANQRRSIRGRTLSGKI